MKQTKGLTPEQQTLFDALTRLQQKICIGVLGGLSSVEAYMQVGGRAKTKNTVISSVGEILRNPAVKAFMDSVMRNEALDTIMAREEVLERLTVLGRFKITDICDFTSDGWAFKPGIELTPDQAYSIQELTSTRDGLKIKLHSAPEAIKQLRAMQGWDAAEKHVLTNKAGEDVLPSAEELAKRMLFLLNQGALGAERENHKIIEVS